MSNKTKVLMGKATVFEKIIYGLGDIGANFAWTFMSLFITMYYTDSIGISAAFAGTMMLVTRLFDGVSDVIFAWIVEKVHFKWGKIRPWFLIAAPLMGLGIYLCFHVPTGLTTSSKEIYAFATYFFMAVISYTIYNIAYSGFLPLMSTDSNDRNIISALGRIMTMAGILVMNVITPTLLALWGGERAPEAWANISVIYAAICTVLVALMGICIQEKHTDSVEVDAISQKKVPMKQMLGIIFREKHFWMLAILFMAFYMATGVSSVSTYFYRDVLGNMDLLGLMSLLGVVPTLLCMPFIPVMFQKFGKKKTVIVTLALTVLSDIMAIFLHSNMLLYCISRVMNSVCKIPFSAAIYTFIADLVDHVWETHKIRTEGLMAMASSVGTKIGTGLGTAFVGWGLAWCGYDQIATAQTSGAKLGITLIFFGIPLLGYLTALIVVKFWNIGTEK